MPVPYREFCSFPGAVPTNVETLSRCCLRMCCWFRGSSITPALLSLVGDKTVWQYKVLTRDVPQSPSEEELNALGQEGWDLTAVLTQGGVTHFYFKRMKD